MPTEEQIGAGNRVASELTTACAQKNMHGLGGCKKFDIKNFEFKEIITLYLNGDIDSVTGIWLAMQEIDDGGVIMSLKGKRVAEAILSIRRGMIDESGGGDPNSWDILLGMQAYRDSLEAMKRDGLISEYNLAEDTAEL